jgi:drug/metabolite transporter (DMT)-like permease
MPTTTTDRVMNRAVLALCAAAALWGLSFLFGKIALRALPATHVVLGRFVIGTALLLPLSRYRFPQITIAKDDRLRFVLAAVLMVPISFFLQFEGLDRTSAARASLIIGAAPPIMAVASVVVGTDRLSLGEWLAVAGSVLGVVVMVGRPDTAGDTTGDLMVLGSILTLTVWSIVTKDLMDRYPPLFTTAVCMAAGTVFMVPVALLWSGLPALTLAPLTWTSLAVLGAGCTALTYALWNWGLRHVGVARSGVFLNIEPVVGAVLGVLILGDRLDAWTIAGGCLIIGSTFWISRQT